MTGSAAQRTARLAKLNPADWPRTPQPLPARQGEGAPRRAPGRAYA